MARYFIEVSYKGTAYSGFQVQENANTIQSELEKALVTLHRSPIQLTGSSRTDAGVHALQNYFHFDYDDQLHPQAVYKLNAILPGDIVIRNIHKLKPDAHSRFDATSREYIYKLHTYKNPFLSDASFYYPYKLDKERLDEAASFVLTQQNFFAFSKTNSQVNNFQCKILKSQWVIDGEMLIYNVEANRFLRGMVRLLTGTLLKIGRGRMSHSEFSSLFTNHFRLGHSVPAHGLYLKGVFFPPHYFQ